MVACTFCSNVSAPPWWEQTGGVHLLVAVLVVLGLVVGGAALLQEGWRHRTAGLRIGLGLGVLLPLSAALVWLGSTTIDVRTDRPPMDADAWSIDCAASVQAPAADSELSQAFTTACSDATRGRRWGAYAALAGAIGFTAWGVAGLIRPRRRDDPAAPDDSVDTGQRGWQTGQDQVVRPASG